MKRTMPIAGLASLLAVCAVSRPARAGREGDAGPDTSGRTLATFNAIVVAPDTAWRWSYQGVVRQGSAILDAFECKRVVNDRDPGYAFAVSRLPVDRVNEATMDAFVREVSQEVKSVKFSLARPVYERSDIPFPGASYRFRYEAVSSFATAYMFGYFGHHNRIYVTQCFSLSPDEPAEFTRFSSSIIARGGSARPGQGVALFFVPIAVGILMSWLRRRGRED